jgi:hypothetical protein
VQASGGVGRGRARARGGCGSWFSTSPGSQRFSSAPQHTHVLAAVACARSLRQTVDSPALLQPNAEPSPRSGSEARRVAYPDTADPVSGRVSADMLGPQPTARELRPGRSAAPRRVPVCGSSSRTRQGSQLFLYSAQVAPAVSPVTTSFSSCPGAGWRLRTGWNPGRPYPRRGRVWQGLPGKTGKGGTHAGSEGCRPSPCPT